MKEENLNAAVPPESLVKWSLQEANRERERAKKEHLRAESVAKYAKELEETVRTQNDRIATLEEIIASHPAQEEKKERKAREKRRKKFREHLKKYLGILRTEEKYIEELLTITEQSV